MRVLYFSPRDCWPITTGARLRDFHLARQLARNAAVTYIGFSNEDTRRERLEPLSNSEVVLVRRDARYAPANLLRGLLGPLPISVLNYTSAAMFAEIERLLREQAFDAIQVEGVHLFAYVRRIRELAPRARLICDWHNIESELMARYADNGPNLAKRLYASRTSGLLRRLEDRLLGLADAHTVCSPRERTALLERAPSARIEVIGNGVDVEYLSDQAHAAVDRKDIVFVGSMDYHANIDAAMYFADEIWPLVQARRPELRYMIVGSRPAAEVLALGQRPGITVTGTVEDVRPYYRKALAVLAPVRVASGTRLKVLEAMASGTPVISTTLGAEGLTVTDRQDIILADTPAAMADAIVALQAGSAEWRTIAANAHRLVESRYDWSIIGDALRRLYAEQLEAAWA
jgi:sugar transferase (PEP-CTERM/EpsH1 system associated)